MVSPVRARPADDGTPLKVLVVDDMRTMQMLVRTYLVGRNYDFAYASSGREAIEKARAEGPRLVISDLRMPDMSGDELCAALRREPGLSRVPFILMSSDAGSVEARRAAIRCGADALVAKPLDSAMLTKVVEVVLRGGRLTPPPP